MHIGWVGFGFNDKEDLQNENENKSENEIEIVEKGERERFGLRIKRR